MKLRNKKTGEIVDLSEGFIKDTYNGQFILIKPVAISNKEGYLYDSLAGLNEEWEDYTSGEPLIKDERIRRAVRAWVEIGKYEHIYYDRAYNRLADDYDFVHCIEFSIDPCPEADSGRCYTLTELCGEEKE